MKKISKNMKKILALLCSFAIVASSVFIEFPAKQAQASEESTIPSEEEQQTSSEQLKEITFDDFGISDGTFKTTEGKGTYQGGDTLIGTVFTGKVKFDTTSKNGLMYIGGSNDDTSLIVRVGQSSIKVYTTAKNSSNKEYIPDETYKYWVTSSDVKYDFGFDTFVNQEFELKLSFECVNRDDDEVANDLKLGMWINGVMCNQNSYIYAEDYVSKMGTYLYVPGSNYWGAPTVESVVSGAVPTGLKELTFKDFEIADNTYTTIKQGKYAEEENLIGTVFTGKVKFADTVSTSANNGMLYFGSADTNALIVRVGGSSIKVYTAATNSSNTASIPDNKFKYWVTENTETEYIYDFGFSSFKNQEFELKLSFECVNRDGDDVANDLKLGMWVNGVMCNQNSYIYAEDYVSKMGNSIQISNASSPKVTSTVKDSLPEELKEVTFEDFGIDNGTYTTSGDAGTYSGANNLINTVFSGKLNCNTTGDNVDAIMYIGGTNDTTSLIVRVGRTTIRVHTENLSTYGITDLDKNSFVFNCSDYDFGSLTSFNGQEFDLKLSFECVNRDGGDVANDLKLGMWINGVMCNNNDYIYLNNYVDLMGTNLHVCGASEGMGGIPTVTSTSSEDQTGVRFSSKRSFWDYGIGDGWYTNEFVNGTLSHANSVSISTLFSGDFVFSPIGTTSLFFGGTSAEDGFSLSTSGKNLILKDESNDTVIKTFYPGGAHATLVGTLLNVKFTYRDSKLGVWFNDRLYANEYIAASSFGNFMQITCDENANTRVISERFDMELPSYSYDLAKGNYVISGEDTILVTNNGTVEKWNGDELTIAGEYEISTYGGLYKKSMTLYRTGDVHIDNETNILDIVAALKVKKNGTEQKFIQLGADMNGDGTVNAIDISDIRCSLIGAATSEKLASIHYQEDAVGAIMPIVGKNTTWTVEELTQRDTIHALQAAGINLMDATGVSYNTNKNALYRALSFAEKYGIGMYATDGREHSDSTSGISQAIKEYSQFTSLKGISDLQSLTQYAVPTTFATISIDSSSDATNVLMQVNRSLADGAKGVQYVWSDDIVDLGALVGKANAQIAAVDHILMNAKYKSQETETNYVMSTFDYQGKTAYYVVNSSLTDNAEVILDLTQNQQYQLYATSNNCSNSDTEGTGQCTLTLTPGGAALVLLQ